ncbi:MAG: hypothetical protein II260_03025 [Muribaculaceae bacterium]|nr:hypothetical protein [Muribaculaceae bacterium]
MRTRNLLRAAVVILASGFIATGCIDENYDLSNVDTTAELQVKDLVLPLDIDEIAMREFINIEDTGHIQVINGEYVLIDSGTYSTDDIIIPAINIPAPSVAPITTTIKLLGNGNTPSSTKALPTLPTFPLVFDIGRQVSEFEYKTSNISDYIVDIDLIGANFDITIDLVAEGLEKNIKSWTLEDFTMRLPKGLTGETNIGIYDPETGIVEIGGLVVEGTKATFKMSITEVDVKKAGVVFDYDTHSISFKDEIGIHTGHVVVGKDDIKSLAGLPATADLKILFSMGNINVEMFGGTIQYNLEGIEIADIPITGIPTILSQETTDLILANPQVYVCFSNPLGTNYGLYAQTGLTLTAKRPGQPDQKYSLDNPYFELSCNGCQGCKFCLSPEDPGQGNYWGKFVDAQHIPFSSLAYVLSGKGLPRSIGISLDNPCIPKQKIAHFPVGTNLGKMTGCYTIFAPLQLREGSQIVFSSTEKGWWNEEMDKLSIKYLQIDAMVTNDLPVDVEITGYPIDRDGNQIEDVVIEGFHLETGVEDSPLHIKMEGKIEHLDGVVFVAKAKATGQALRPDEHIILKDLKVKVSGSYLTEF